MPGKDRQRQLARQRHERRVARRAAARARRRRRNQVTGVVLAVLAVIGGVVALAVTLSGSGSTVAAAPTGSASPSASASPQAVACGAAAPPAPKRMTFAKEPPMTIDKSATYTMTLDTSCGTIPITLDAAKAPHTVNSLKFLADKGYFNGTFCHRETSSPTLTVLQCGDQTGTGTGGPGYTLPEEDLKGAKYTRGIVAMAKTSAPHSTGSQFFLIDKDSQLPPQYTVVGRMSATGLQVLDKIVAIGIAGGSTDGPPKEKVYLDKVTVTTKP